MAKATVKSTSKQKRGQAANSASKQAKKNWIELAYVLVKSSSSQNLITNRLHPTWELFSTFVKCQFFSLNYYSRLGDFLSIAVYQTIILIFQFSILNFLLG